MKKLNKQTVTLITSMLFGIGLLLSSNAFAKDKADKDYVTQTELGRAIEDIELTPGPQGDTGLTGADGERGPIGVTGAVGAQGPVGDTGAVGERGLIGVTGAIGEQGPIGDTGAAGEQGPVGDTGAVGERGPIGQTGFNGADGTTISDGENDGDLLTWKEVNGGIWIASQPNIPSFSTILSNSPSVSNMQPYQAINYIIALQGIFPSRNSIDPFIGEIIMFAGNFAPRGWALCDGQLLPISSNTALFSILGTTYGGDGRTTFGLPDLRGRAPVHAGNGPGLSPRQLGAKGGSENVQ